MVSAAMVSGKVSVTGACRPAAWSGL